MVNWKGGLAMFFRTAYFLQQCRKNQWLPRRELEKLQLKRLKAMVNYAYDNVHYYRELFKENNLHPDQIKSLDDIEKIPVTTKQSLIKNFPKDIVSKKTDFSDCSIEQTSGSTGLYLKVARNSRTKDYELALVMHALFECGLGLRDKLMVFEDPRHFGDEKTTILNRLGFLRKEKASVFENSESLLGELQRKTPDAIYGYPSTSFLISQLMKKKGVSLKKKLKFMVSVSETLYPKFRNTIEQEFRCNVFDHYGSTEFPRIAWQCGEKGFLHINADSHIVEFLKGGKPVEGKQGLVTITSLYNFGMPFLRYSLDDVSESAAGECACGRSLPLMKSVEGRMDDFVIDSAGRALSPKILCYEFDEIQGVQEYKVMQKEAGKATLFAVRGEHFDEDELKGAVKNIAHWSDGLLKIKVVYKKSIPKEGRKLRRVRSSLKPVF
jgi:phenylacetate-CoA ligase